MCDCSYNTGKAHQETENRVLPLRPGDIWKKYFPVNAGNPEPVPSVKAGGYGIFCQKCFFRKEKTVLQKDHGRSVGLINLENIRYGISGCDQMLSAGVILSGNIASHCGKGSRGKGIPSIYMVDQILNSFFHKKTFQMVMLQKTGNVVLEIFQENTGSLHRFIKLYDHRGKIHAGSQEAPAVPVPDRDLQFCCYRKVEESAVVPAG